MAAQENLLFYDVQKAKQSNIAFQDISASLVKSDIGNKDILKQFLNGNEVSSIQYTPSKGQKLGNALAFKLPLKNKNVELELLEAPSSYEVVTSDGQRYPANSEIKHYQGTVKGQPGSVVALTFYEDEIMGFVATDEGNYNISKENASGKHLVFLESNLKGKRHFDCGTSDYPEDWDGDSMYDPEILLQEFSAPKVVSANAEEEPLYFPDNPGKYVRLYIETEHDIYQHFEGSTTAVETYVSGLMNQVRTLYYKENITAMLYQLHIWTTADPYTGTSAETLLSQFQNTRTSISCDLGMLLTFKGVPQGIAAEIGGVCNSNTANKLAVSFVNQYYPETLVYSRTVKVVTHEFGHLLGSRHSGTLHRQATSTGEDVMFDVSGLKNGFYILHVHDGIADKPEVHKIIVNH
jgi:hypothetical protein